jgi:excisionase family DNA binding protein
MDKELLTIDDLRTYLSIGRTTVFKLIKQGFPHVRIGKKILFRQADIDAWIEARVINPRPKKKAD